VTRIVWNNLTKGEEREKVELRTFGNECICNTISKVTPCKHLVLIDNADLVRIWTLCTCELISVLQKNGVCIHICTYACICLYSPSIIYTREGKRERREVYDFWKNGWGGVQGWQVLRCRLSKLEALGNQCFSLSPKIGKSNAPVKSCQTKGMSSDAHFFLCSIHPLIGWSLLTHSQTHPE
jgi:hypothetical protein